MTGLAVEVARPQMLVLDKDFSDDELGLAALSLIPASKKKCRLSLSLFFRATARLLGLLVCLPSIVFVAAPFVYPRWLKEASVLES